LIVPDIRLRDCDALTTHLPNPRPMTGHGLVEPGKVCDCCAENKLS